MAGADAFTPLVLASEWDERLRLGTAVVPVHTRGPAALAMSAAALADLAPGRFVLGIGASSETIVTGWNGIAYDPPLARTRDVLRFLRQAFAGEKVDGEFDSFTIRRFRLEKAPDVPPSIMLAALRPQMLRLAAREADGAITNWLSADDVRQVRAELGPDKELAARIFVCVTEDAEMARNIGRFLIATYLTVPGYAAFHDWLGRGAAMKEMREAWAAGDRNAAMAAVPVEVIDDLVVHGTAARMPRAHQPVRRPTAWTPPSSPPCRPAPTCWKPPAPSRRPAVRTLVWQRRQRRVRCVHSERWRRS